MISWWSLDAPDLNVWASLETSLDLALQPHVWIFFFHLSLRQTSRSVQRHVVHSGMSETHFHPIWIGMLVWFKSLLADWTVTSSPVCDIHTDPPYVCVAPQCPQLVWPGWFAPGPTPPPAWAPPTASGAEAPPTHYQTVPAVPLPNARRCTPFRWPHRSSALLCLHLRSPTPRIQHFLKQAPPPASLGFGIFGDDSVLFYSLLLTIWHGDILAVSWLIFICSCVVAVLSTLVVLLKNPFVFVTSFSLLNGLIWRKLCSFVNILSKMSELWTHRNPATEGDVDSTCSGLFSCFFWSVRVWLFPFLLCSYPILFQD